MAKLEDKLRLMNGQLISIAKRSKLAELSSLVQARKELQKGDISAFFRLSAQFLAAVRDGHKDAKLLWVDGGRAPANIKEEDLDQAMTIAYNIEAEEEKWNDTKQT